MPCLVPPLFHFVPPVWSHQTRLWPRRPFLAVLDPVWPYIWPKWLEQECCPLEQVNPYQNKAENIIGCHGKPTLNPPPSLTHCDEVGSVKRKCLRIFFLKWSEIAYKIGRITFFTPWLLFCFSINSMTFVLFQCQQHFYVMLEQDTSLDWRNSVKYRWNKSG